MDKGGVHGPLAPRQMPVNAKSSFRLPEHNFKLVTDDVSALARLMYALKDDLVGDVRLYANKDGVRISESIANNNIFVFMSIEKTALLEYECDGDNVICFEPKQMYDAINTHQSGYIVSLEIVVDPAAKKKKEREKRKQNHGYDSEDAVKSLISKAQDRAEAVADAEVTPLSASAVPKPFKVKQKRARMCNFVADGNDNDNEDNDYDDDGDDGDDDDDKMEEKEEAEEEAFNNNLGANSETWGHGQKQYFIHVEARSIDGTGVFEYEVPLLRSFRTVYKAKPQEKDYFLAMDTTVFVNDILDTFGSLRSHFTSDYLTIDCTEDRISFYMKGESSDMMKNASFTMITRKDPSEAANRKIRKSKKKPELSEVESETKRKRVQAPRIVADYCLVYLLRLRKVFSINRGFIFMYIEANYPLVFRVNVGTLGCLHAVLMFKAEGDENNDE